jgi:hypothetical protein
MTVHWSTFFDDGYLQILFPVLENPKNTRVIMIHQAAVRGGETAVQA